MHVAWDIKSSNVNISVEYHVLIQMCLCFFSYERLLLHAICQYMDLTSASEWTLLLHSDIGNLWLFSYEAGVNSSFLRSNTFTNSFYIQSSEKERTPFWILWFYGSSYNVVSVRWGLQAFFYAQLSGGPTTAFQSGWGLDLTGALQHFDSFLFQPLCFRFPGVLVIIVL